ncbi:MAG: hypothetical protein KG029_07765 [Bacteroidetes bacterium]|nr:hypothetical protein [Bacteroidota bacterium]
MSGRKVIIKILEVERLNAKRFAEIIGVQPTQVYDLKSGKIKKISESVADKILDKFSKYSKTWLLTGDGEMLSESSLSKKVAGKIADLNHDYEVNNQNDSITMSREVFEMLNKLTDTVQSQQRVIENDMSEIKAAFKKAHPHGGNHNADIAGAV